MSAPKTPGFESPKGTNALVTGASGFVGARLVEILLERGSKTVFAFDITAPSEELSKRFAKVQETTGGKIICLSQSEGDLCSDAAVEAAFKKVDKIDVVYHMGALVGPFHSKQAYYEVNYKGTLRIVENCKKFKVPKFVYSCSPSTRFTGGDVAGLREEQCPIPKTFMAEYAETKAMGEVEVNKACCDEFMTVSVAPHQVYGPYDALFLPKLLETCGTGRLRIFGNGRSIISVCHVDNYCHGLICGADALYKGSPALAKYYVVTDDHPVSIWKIVNEAGMAMGFADLEKKFHLPLWLLYSVAAVCSFITMLTGKQFKLKYFTVKMLVIHRYFDITNAKRDLQYKPLISFEDGWASTIEWFKVNWLPKWKEAGTSKL
jgi:nucleoside-diphosphate-sugar epimerase